MTKTKSQRQRMTTPTKICPNCNQEMKTDYISIEKDKFRIYKWDKPVKDFPMPEGYELIEERDFIDLYDNDKIELEKGILLKKICAFIN